MPKPSSKEFVNSGDPFIRFYNQHLPDSFWLSNFYPSDVTVDDEAQDFTFKCSEAAFQALRCSKDQWKEFIGLNGHEAWKLAQNKKAENKLLLDRAPDKETMQLVVQLKFFQSAELREKLLSTGSAYLVERARDLFWGDGLNGSGENVLGKICMLAREFLGGSGIVEKPEEYLEFASKYPKHW